MDELEKYGDIYRKMMLEGDGYFFYGYTGRELFEFDPELRVKFEMASDMLEEFKRTLEQKITDLGGKPEDYEE